MEARVLQFINDSREFRGEAKYEEPTIQDTRIAYISGLFFLIIFVTGCAMCSTNKRIITKQQVTTEEPK